MSGFVVSEDVEKDRLRLESVKKKSDVPLSAGRWGAVAEIRLASTVT